MSVQTSSGFCAASRASRSASGTSSPIFRNSSQPRTRRRAPPASAAGLPFICTTTSSLGRRSCSATNFATCAAVSANDTFASQ